MDQVERGRGGHDLARLTEGDTGATSQSRSMRWPFVLSTWPVGRRRSEWTKEFVYSDRLHILRTLEFDTDLGAVKLECSVVMRKGQTLVPGVFLLLLLCAASASAEDAIVMAVVGRDRTDAERLSERVNRVWTACGFSSRLSTRRPRSKLPAGSGCLVGVAQEPRRPGRVRGPTAHVERHREARRRRRAQREMTAGPGRRRW